MAARIAATMSSKQQQAVGNSFDLSASNAHSSHFKPPAGAPGQVSASVRKRAMQGSICQFCRLRFHPGERVALFDPEDAATEEEA